MIRAFVAMLLLPGAGYTALPLTVSSPNTQEVVRS